MAVFVRLRSAIQHLDKGTVDLHLATQGDVRRTVTIAAQAVPDMLLNLFAFLGFYQKALAQRGETSPEVPLFRPVGFNRAIYDQDQPVLIFQFQGGAEISFLIPRSALPEIRGSLAELETILSRQSSA